MGVTLSWLLNRHSRLRSLLSDYVDGQVTESERDRVDAHLAGCERCRSELEGLRATVGLLGALPELRVPRSFALRESPVRVTSTSGLVWGTRFATAAAGSLVAALLIGNAVGLFAQSGRVSGLDTPAPEVAAARAAPATQAFSSAAAIPSPAPADTKVDADDEAVEEAAVEEAGVESAAASELPTPAPEPTTALAAQATTESVIVEEDRQEPDTDDGLKLPLWQLEAAAGGLFALLAAATGWLALRNRRRPF